jgi:hypothetical protein
MEFNENPWSWIESKIQCIVFKKVKLSIREPGSIRKANQNVHQLFLNHSAAGSVSYFFMGLPGWLI